jgi:hypothetical protein
LSAALEGSIRAAVGLSVMGSAAAYDPALELGKPG